MKTSILILITLFITVKSQAQKFYLEMGTGYAFNNSKSAILSNSTSEDRMYSFASSISTNDETAVYNEFGGGMNFSVTAGYQLLPNISIEAGIDHRFNHSFSATSKSAMYFNDQIDNESVDKMNFTSSYTAFDMGLKVKHEFEKVNVYLGAGLLFSSVNLSIEGNFARTDYSSGTPDLSTTLMNRELNSPITLGNYFTIGAAYEISDKISAFGEVKMTSLSVKPESMNITKYETDGVDLLPTLDESDKHYVYADHVTTNSQTDDPSSPRKVLNNMAIDFSNYSFQVGIRYNLF